MSYIASQVSDPFSLARDMAFGDIHFKYDEKSGLKSIIAIHNTTLGPALGGCRFVAYDSTEDALIDAMRLARGMSYKAAIAGLALGGGKSVIMKPQNEFDRKRLFTAFGDFVNDLGGRYITAMDSGTSVEDMDVIASRTKFVGSASTGNRATGDPSPFTALGVFRSIQAAIKFRRNQSSLNNIHVAIQGAGHVGYQLARLLHEAGAKLTICDRNPPLIKRVKDEFNASIVELDEIFNVECDVFSPCARGAIINEENVEKLHCEMLVGAANNQLANPEMAENLQMKNILYAPDYVVNAGGLIQVSAMQESIVSEKIDNIYASLLGIFQQSVTSGKTTADIADEMAVAIIERAANAH